MGLESALGSMFSGVCGTRDRPGPCSFFENDPDPGIFNIHPVPGPSIFENCSPTPFPASPKITPGPGPASAFITKKKFVVRKNYHSLKKFINSIFHRKKKLNEKDDLKFRWERGPSHIEILRHLFFSPI